MKYTIISDIHSNLPALNEFIKLYDHSTKLVCLGDIIGYGADPVECSDFIRNNAFASINGNHERMLFDVSFRAYANPIARTAIQWTENHLNSHDKIFLKKLKKTHVLEDKFLLVHGAPKHPDQYINNSLIAREAMQNLHELDFRICFYGHTHIAGYFDENESFIKEQNHEYQLEEGKSYLINPGSIGQPRDRDSSGSYCLFDSDKLTLEFRRFEYPIEEAADRIREAGLPENLAMRLFYGI